MKHYMKYFHCLYRVEEEDLIFYGARPQNESFSPLEACTCTHRLFVGAECECGRGTVTELCDLFMGRWQCFLLLFYYIVNVIELD